MGTDLASLTGLALALADAADEVSLRHFGGRQATEEKADGSPVTAADREVERVLREGLARAVPAHAILGEEEGGSLEGGLTWVLDPIDGTANFMRGIPVYATLIALLDDGEPVLGVASAPAMGERWHATRGGGAFRNRDPVRVSDVAALADAQTCHGGLNWWRSSPRQWEALGRLTDASARVRGFGDFWMHLLVAGGMADVAVDRDLKPWDIAAVQCIVTEAGGRMTSYEGGPPMASGETVSTNGLLHDEVLALLADALDR